MFSFATGRRKRERPKPKPPDAAPRIRPKTRSRRSASLKSASIRSVFISRTKSKRNRQKPQVSGLAPIRVRVVRTLPGAPAEEQPHQPPRPYRFTVRRRRQRIRHDRYTASRLARAGNLYVSFALHTITFFRAPRKGTPQKTEDNKPAEVRSWVV